MKKLPSGYYLVDMANNRYKEWVPSKPRQKKPGTKEINKATSEGKRYFYIEDKETKQKRYNGENRAYYNVGINGSGSVETFALRPGWHAGSLPSMMQIGKGTNKDIRDDSFIWVEGEVPADVDYQEEADNSPTRDIATHIPTDGYYLFATNPRKDKAQANDIDWYVAGAFKPNRIISDDEARAVIDKFNAEHNANVSYDYSREGGRKFYADTMKVENPRYSWKDSEGYLHLDIDDELSPEDFQKFVDKIVGKEKRTEAHLRYLNHQVRDRIVINDAELTRFVRKLKEDYALNGSLKDITSELRSVFEKSTDKNFDKTVEAISKKLIDDSKQMDIDESLKREADALKKELKTYTFALSENQRKELKYTYGPNWSSRFLGKLNFRKEGIKLDEIWGELSQRYPHYFEEMTDADEGVTIAEFVDRLYSGDFEGVKWDKETTKQRLNQMIFDIRAESWNVADNLTMAEKYEIAIRELREKLRESKEEFRDEAQRQRLIQRIIEREDSLGRKLRKGDAKEHIPQVLQDPLKEVLKMVRVDSKIPTRDMQNNFAALAIALEKVPNQADAKDNLLHYFDTNTYFVQRVNEITEEVEKSLGKLRGTTKDNVSISDLPLDSLKKLNEVLTAINHAIYTYDKALGTQKAQSIDERGRSTLEFTGNIVPKGVEKNDLTEMLGSFLGWENTTPIYGFDRFGDGGKQTFEEFMDADDKLTKNSEVVINFMKNTVDGDTIDKWNKELHPVTIDGKEYLITTAQLMSLYCLNKRQSAHQHLYTAKNVYGEDIEGQGIVIGKIKRNASNSFKGQIKTRPIAVSASEVTRLTNLLTQEQKDVADKLQNFMSTVCSDWGNYVTMRRFGIMQFGEENYFPMQVFRENAESEPAEIPQAASIFKLLNMGFTKSLNERGNGALELNSIFDIFIKHASEMAEYNAYALPILDAYKWYSYKTKEANGETLSLKTSVTRAYGHDGVKFITDYLEDLNGRQNNYSSVEKLAKWLITHYKSAAVAANIRVVFMQPCAYLRAYNCIDAKYMTKALNANPAEIKRRAEEMNEKSTLAQKKNGLGAFNVNISKTVEQQALQTSGRKNIAGYAESTKDVLMKPAAIADELTWGTLYYAVQLETKDLHPDLKGAEFDEVVNKRFREICYRTQVFDSINARSDIMRKKDVFSQIATAFMSEPTLSWSMLSNEAFMFELDARTNPKLAWKKHAKKIKRAMISFLMTAAATSAVAALPDWARDDDDSKEFIEQFLDNFKKNLFGEVTGLLPWVRDIQSILIDGFNPSRPDEEIIVAARRMYNAWKAVFKDGEDIGYRQIYNTAKAISTGTGLPISNVIRDFKALWNKTVGKIFGMEIK